MVLKRLIFIPAFILALILPLAGFSLSPMNHYQDLIAGNGNADFRDGLFYSSEFNRPQGLSVSPDGNLLYVADTANNRIRVIDLDNKNNVGTLAGQATAGRLDGPCSVALFNQPVCVAVLPGDRLAVFDSGDQALRLIDLKSKTVSTLVGLERGADGKVSNLVLGDVWSMAYFAKDNGLYLAEPRNGTVKKINLENRQVETVLKNETLVPNPKALCAANGRLYVADEKLGAVYEIVPAGGAALKPGANPSPTAAPSVTLNLVGTAKSVLELSASPQALYAYQVDPQFPVARVFPTPGPLTFVSIAGYKLINPGVEQILPHFEGSSQGVRVGMAPDPHSDGKFFITNYTNSMVCSFRDLNFGAVDFAHGEDAVNSGRLHDFEYPERKPKNTFRILVVGRCWLYWPWDDKGYETNDVVEDQNYLKGLAKQMESALNTRAALEDWPCHFEVLNGGMHSGSNCLEFWPYYVVPRVVKKYDVDLVLVLHDDGINFFDAYFQCPISPEGIPQEAFDPEFKLKPNSEKFASGPMFDFLKLVQARDKKFDLATATDGDLNGLFTGFILVPELREKLSEMMQTPLRLFKQKIGSMTTSGGKPCQLETLYFPVSLFAKDDLRDFFRETYEKAGIPFVNLSDDLAVLGMSYAPLRKTIGIGHFTDKGMSVFSEIIIHELIKNKSIPAADIPR